MDACVVPEKGLRFVLNAHCRKGKDMLVERKYKVTRIYASSRDVRINKKLESPKLIGVYSGIDALHAIKEASKVTGIYMDFMTASLMEERKDDEA